MRIVSLCPSLTETVFRLGKGKTLVGRTKFCVQPAAEVSAVERLGGTKNPRLERIVALAPDLVLMNEEENRREDAEALIGRGLNVLSTFSKDVPGAIASVREIGALIGAVAAAKVLAQEIEARAADVAARAAVLPRVRFVYLIWKDPIMAVAPGTYVDGLLSLAGGENVVTADAGRYPTLEADMLARADQVLLSSEPFPFEERHLVELSAETGLAATRFQLVDGELLSWHGARTLEGLAYALRILHEPVL
jgi:iron complex transport system substrate-binding protein